MASTRQQCVPARPGGQAQRGRRDATDGGATAIEILRWGWRRIDRYLVLAGLLHVAVAGLLALMWFSVPRPPPQPTIVIAELVAPPAPSSHRSTEPSPPAPGRDAAAPLPAGTIAPLPSTPPAPVPVQEQTSVAVAVAAAPPVVASESSPVPVDPGIPDVLQRAEGGPDMRAETAAREWDQAVLAHLERHKRYPGVAQRRGDEDAVILQLRVDRAGGVLSQEIVDSRGFALLDTEAMDLVRRSSPLPPPPPEVPDRDLEFRVPVQFYIQDRVTRLW